MSIENPSDKPCWNPCVSCHRCADKGKYDRCADCSGRYDPARRIYADPDDRCDCKNGILRWKTQKGQKIVAPLTKNPFEGKVIQKDTESEDERDWQAYLKSEQERRDDPNWDPLMFDDGTSTNAWMERYKRGY